MDDNKKPFDWEDVMKEEFKTPPEAQEMPTIEKVESEAERRNRETVERRRRDNAEVEEEVVEPKKVPTIEDLYPNMPQPQRQNQYGGPIPVLLAVMVILFGGTIAFVAYKKMEAGKEVVRKPVFSSPKETPKETPNEPPKEDESVKELKNEIEALKKEIVKIKFNYAKNRDKIQVLGLITNENASVYRYGHSRSDIVLISRRWGMTGSPRHLTLTPSDMEFLNSLPIYKDIDVEKSSDGKEIKEDASLLLSQPKEDQVVVKDEPKKPAPQPVTTYKRRGLFGRN